MRGKARPYRGCPFISSISSYGTSLAYSALLPPSHLPLFRRERRFPHSHPMRTAHREASDAAPAVHPRKSEESACVFPIYPCSSKAVSFVVFCLRRTQSKAHGPYLWSGKPDLLSILPSSNPRCSAHRVAPSQCFGARIGGALLARKSPFPALWQSWTHTRAD